MLLTQSGGLIIKPISKLLGAILSLIYEGLGLVNSVNIGIAIILFTIIVRLAILPLMVQQSKSTKIMNYIQPEINKVTKKYKGRKDQESMMAQQRETKAIQDKYGVSLTFGCLTSLIQLPIFFALYRVIQNIPAYVGKVKNLYTPISDAIANDEKAYSILEKFQSGSIQGSEGYANLLRNVKLDKADPNTIIDVLAKFPAEAWGDYKAQLAASSEVVTQINANVDQINKIYDFFGINLTSVPGFAMTTAIIIPILSLVFQFLSMKVTPQQQSTDPTQQASMQTMKTMMYVMPVFSFFICVNVPCGVGLYWAVGAFISFLTSLIINIYFKYCDMEKILEKSMKKAAKKMEKKKASGKQSFWDKMQEAALGQAPDDSNKVNSTAANASLKNYTSNTMNKNNSNTQYRAGSLAAKANAMQRYNDNNNGGKN